MPDRCDILILGGGIAGMSLAAHLPGGLDVRLWEAEDHLATHTTGRSAAMFEPNYGNPDIRALAEASFPVLERLGVLSPRGVLMVANDTEVGDFEAELQKGVLDEISLDAACGHVPILNRDAIVRAGYSAQARDIDVMGLFGHFRKTARDRGVIIETGCRATRIEAGSDGWTVEAGDRVVTAGKLVNAAGAWADDVAEIAGVARKGLQPLRRSIAVLPPPGGHDVRRWPMLLSASESWYGKPEGGSWLVSPAEEMPVPPHDAYVEDLDLAEGLDRYAAHVTVPVTRVNASWAGLRSFLPDRRPAVGFERGAPGFFWLAGQGGYGIMTSPALGAFAAACLTGGSLPDTVDPAALAPERLGWTA
ncbi:NAD(P)/FAD-dependent oxidoreductase [Oceanomicrobium pacificus]|uniref:FAD-dependent oxidoreductase n=1 Tax=Oceanomicrobium pacificus TaxID=2692916 RepID=A0A6B0TU19_9RHOB|nr:FAD-binding oxidoreductase [Oceanomicrobium pacificus]MXU64453.1 FAD-dependent oxidoreductase [Oceanomicrobium pacificus]